MAVVLRDLEAVDRAIVLGRSQEKALGANFCGRQVNGSGEPEGRIGCIVESLHLLEVSGLRDGEIRDAAVNRTGHKQQVFAAALACGEPDGAL